MEPFWTPSAERISRARITDFRHWLAQRDSNTDFADYDSLWHWSSTDLEGFWAAAWDYFDIQSAAPWSVVLTDREMPGARWFPGARLNYVNQVFRHRSADRPALLFGDERGTRVNLSWAELEQQVAAFAETLRMQGVAQGDRVAACLPNRPETVVAFLACASLGAIWSLCSPDMGASSVLDRFQQIEPKILIACDGYQYGGKQYPRLDSMCQIRDALPSVQHMVLVPVLGLDAEEAGALDWQAATSDRNALLVPVNVPFEHPLWIVYSSGTTGLPKPIVHGHGGIILAMSVSLGLHNDLGPQDRYHWYSSTGWIMWNCQVGGLLLGSTLCLFDGNPGYPDLGVLWRFAAEVGATFFGAGAAYYASCLKAGLCPNDDYDLSALRSVGSTGSPLANECYDWILANVGTNVWLTPMSGGTDLAGPFIAGNPAQPVYRGEMQCRVLGAAVHAFDEAGHAVLDEVGELVCTAPMPCMPVFFWNDPDNARYLDSYFDTYPGVWRHGDWMRVTPRNGVVIYGRSDATINRYGIRMGTSELYQAVEALPEVLDTLVVDLEYLGRPSYMPLFVVLREGYTLDQPLRERIMQAIRTALTPRHTPNDIFAVADIPRTLSGKKLELPIKKLLLGQPLEKVVNRDAMANPDSLGWYVAFAERWRSGSERQ